VKVAATVQFAVIGLVVYVIALFQWDFENHLYWATAVFAAAMATDQIDGWLARRWDDPAFGIDGSSLWYTGQRAQNLGTNFLGAVGVVQLDELVGDWFAVMFT